MKTASVLLLALLFAPGATAVELDEAEQAMCTDQGGCHVLTLRSLEDFFRKAFAAGHAAGVSQRCGA